MRKITPWFTAVLVGAFATTVREFPAGTYHVDMAQPMANAALRRDTLRFSAKVTVIVGPG